VTAITAFQYIDLGPLRCYIHKDICIPEFLKGLSDPDGLLAASDLLFKDSARTKAGRVTICGRPFFLKHYRRRGILHTAKTLFMTSRPWRNLKIAVHLIQNGVDTPAPLALLEERRSGLLMRSYLLTEYVSGEAIRDLIARHMGDMAWQTGILKKMADFIARFHASGCCHRDLKANNILLETDRDIERPWIVDLDGARLRQGLTERDRILDLGRLLTSFSGTLSPSQIYRFFIYYCKKSEIWQDTQVRRDIAGRLETVLSVHLDRHKKKEKARVKAI
jgi:tRNA A-37 threonylcarbamoyl transferase component Bud32